jgi:Ca2+-transporting ATPase
MILLLLAASTLYFFSGKTDDAIFLSSSILLVSAISLYQDSRSRNAIAQLQKLTNPLQYYTDTDFVVPRDINLG